MSRFPTRGESEKSILHRWQSNGFTMGLIPSGDVTRNSKQAYQWQYIKDLGPPKNLNTSVPFAKKIDPYEHIYLKFEMNVPCQTLHNTDLIWRIISNIRLYDSYDILSRCSVFMIQTFPINHYVKSSGRSQTFEFSLNRVELLMNSVNSENLRNHGSINWV